LQVLKDQKVQEDNLEQQEHQEQQEQLEHKDLQDQIRNYKQGLPSGIQFLLNPETRNKRLQFVTPTRLQLEEG
jgi:hypothetical protein